MSDERLGFLAAFAIFAAFLLGGGYLCGAFVAWDWLWVLNMATWDQPGRVFFLLFTFILVGAALGLATDFAKWERQQQVKR